MQTSSFLDRKKSGVKQVGKQSVRKGDWCVFKNVEETDYFLGRVLCMALTEGTAKERSTEIWK